MPTPIVLSALGAALLALAGAGRAQWHPGAGRWGRADETELRVMTWNVRDTLCSTNAKLEGANDWCAMARIVAALRPDVLIVQEAGDNAGHGTGLDQDSAEELETVLGLFVRGGADPFAPGRPAVNCCVQAHAPGYDLPFAAASYSTDGYNRNALLSRFPFADLNGDGKSVLSNLPPLVADGYAPGGSGGLRGYLLAELDLPDELYAGDLVVGNSHLRAGTTPFAHEQRVAAARNIAYYLDHVFNGAGLGLPDPFGKLADYPPVATILGPDTTVVTGGDWNEDEALDPVKGPAEWITRAELADSAGGGDGTDRDRGDMLYDEAQDPFTGSVATLGGVKYDYLAWQDSVAALQRAFLFDSASLPADGSATPPELAGLDGGAGPASSLASDHRPVVVDLTLPAAPCNDAPDLGCAEPGGGGLLPRFTACGAPAPGGSGGGGAVFRLDHAAPFAPAWLVASIRPGRLPFAGGVLVPAPEYLLGPFETDVAGRLRFRDAAAGGGPRELYAQWVVLDPRAAAGASLSNALLLSSGR
ncbi:MAG TPA: hypothetical protein VFD43_08940 [Planctomycetota bacterium]|nr:hypothetical protein [Planctomycetota bacterium]